METTNQLRVRPFARPDLAILGHLESQLCDAARGGGANVVVVERGGQILGCAGWVEAVPQMFGAPVIAEEPEVATALVAALLARARQIGATTLRIGCAGEPAKRAALVVAGFTLRLHFLTLSRRTSPRPVTLPADLVRVPLDPARLRELHDETFAGVDNAPAMSPGEAAETCARAWPDASGLWVTGERAIAFVVAARDGEHVTIDEIGVTGSHRGRGIGRALIEQVIDAAARAGAPEVRALIASTNRASLALHRAAGFREVARREMFEATL